MHALQYHERASQELERIADGNPAIAADIAKKILWLATNADAIKHEQMRGSEECSLHCGAFRILYDLDKKNKIVVVQDIVEHDAAYRRLRRR